MKVLLCDPARLPGGVEERLKGCRDYDLVVLAGSSPYPGDLVLERAAGLARECRVFLVPGLWTSVGDGPDRLLTGLFGPGGEAVGLQEALHAPGFRPGSGLRVFPIGDRQAGLVAGPDLYYPEVFRVLGLLGADLVIVVGEGERPAYPVNCLAGLWQEVQQNQFFGLEGWAKDPPGLAAYAPCEMTAGETGLIHPADLYRPPEDPAEVEVELDFEGLDAIRREYPLRRELNPALYLKYWGDRR